MSLDWAISRLRDTLSSHPKSFTLRFLEAVRSNMASRPELKLEDEAGFIKAFRNLPAKDDDTVRILSRGDYYTAHGEDAVFIARTVSFRLSSIYSSNQGV